MAKKKPEELIQDWCGLHLDQITSRWPQLAVNDGARIYCGGMVYAGDGIVAMLNKAGYKIVPI